MIRVLTETSHDPDRDIILVRTDRPGPSLEVGVTKVLTPAAAPEAGQAGYAVTSAEAGMGWRPPVQRRPRRPLLNCSPGIPKDYPPRGREA